MPGLPRRRGLHSVFARGQGCSTYIRRYLISHFREPIDIASSNFHEESAIFGGSKNFSQAAMNITRQYQPQLIGAATTCLAETIGEDMGQLIYQLKEKHGEGRLRADHPRFDRKLSRHSHRRLSFRGARTGGTTGGRR